MGFVQEFKEFAMKGNVVDLAVGVIIGASFGKIVSSFVADIIMPPIGFLTGGVDFTKLKYALNTGLTGLNGKPLEPVTINYGNFLQASVDFLIVALAMFAVIKVMNNLKKEAPAAPPLPPEPTQEALLLGEIRDLLKTRTPV